MRTIYRYTLPVNDVAVTVQGCLAGPVVHVASRQSPDTVEFWIDGDNTPTARIDRTFCVFGTGHTVPAKAEYRGTALAALGLVWHLYEL